MVLIIVNFFIKYQAFVYTQLHVKTVLFETVQSNISHLFAHCLNVKQTVLFNPQIGPYQMLLLLAGVDLGAMAMKWYSALPKASVLL